MPTYDTGLGIASLAGPRGFAEGGEVTAANFDEQAYLTANPDVRAELEKLGGQGSFKNAYEHYVQYGKAEGRAAFSKAETAAAAAKTAVETKAKQTAALGTVAAAKAAKKAKGFTSAYDNINAGLASDAPEGYAASATATRQAAFAPTLNKFINAGIANTATLSKPYTPTVVAQPYNTSAGYPNVFNPVATAINYNNTPAVAPKGVYTPPVFEPPVFEPPVAPSVGLPFVPPVVQKLPVVPEESAAKRQIVGSTPIDRGEVHLGGGMFRTRDGVVVNSQGVPTNAGEPAAQRQVVGPTPIDQREVHLGGGVFRTPDGATVNSQGVPTLMNMGGIATLGAGGYPRKTGQINGPGTGTSDSIPAMLSDGEFVMTAKAVRGAGKGDRRAGAKRMYALMNQLEKNAARG
jgi:hypothetical protein